MDNLLKKINKQSMIWNITICKKYFYFRNILNISGGKKVRKDIDLFSEFSDFLALKKKDISFCIHYKKYPSYDESYYDCRDWVFDYVGLPDYTYRESKCFADKLLKKDFVDIKYTKNIGVGDVVSYFDSENDSLEVEHWGVVENINNRIWIKSKWGENHVFLHPIEMIPLNYCSDVCFFRKVSKNKSPIKF